MPALHDFALFVYHAQEVAKIIANVLSAKERQTCCTVFQKIYQRLRHGLGRGKLPGTLAWDSTRTVVLKLAPDDAVLLSTARKNFYAALGKISTDGYGVLRLYSSGILIKAVVVASIDDVLDEEIWRNAFRYAATVKLEADHEVQNILNVMLIALAFEQGPLLKALLPLDFTEDADIMTMFGKYVCSTSVSARDILWDALSATTASASLRCAAIESVMWNLIALDYNGTAPSLGMMVRLTHNILRASVTRDMPSSFLGIIEEAERTFWNVMRLAKADAAKFNRRKGSTYVTKLRGRQVIAWVYIIGVLTLAILCAVLNWNERDLVFDRAKDAFEISSILLVSVFGLVKLTSEDPNALRSLATGKLLVEDLTDADKYLGSSSESMQKLLSVDPNMADWASVEGCSYGRAVHGDGLDTGPAEVATLKRCGFFLLEGICKRPHFWDICDSIENANMEVARILPMSELGSELQFSNVPQFSRVS